MGAAASRNNGSRLVFHNANIISQVPTKDNNTPTTSGVSIKETKSGHFNVAINGLKQEDIDETFALFDMHIHQHSNSDSESEGYGLNRFKDLLKSKRQNQGDHAVNVTFELSRMNHKDALLTSRKASSSTTTNSNNNNSTTTTTVPAFRAEKVDPYLHPPGALTLDASDSLISPSDEDEEDSHDNNLSSSRSQGVSGVAAVSPATRRRMLERRRRRRLSRKRKTPMTPTASSSPDSEEEFEFSFNLNDANESKEDNDHPLSFQHSPRSNLWKRELMQRLDKLSEEHKTQPQHRSKRAKHKHKPQVYTYAPQQEYQEMIDKDRDVYCHECKHHFCFCPRNARAMLPISTHYTDPSVEKETREAREEERQQQLHDVHTKEDEEEEEEEETPQPVVMGPPAPVKMTEAIIVAHQDEIASKEKQPTQCPQCRFLFDSEAQRDAHFLQHHTVKCGDCGTHFVSVEFLNQHVMQHLQQSLNDNLQEEEIFAEERDLVV